MAHNNNGTYVLKLLFEYLQQLIFLTNSTIYKKLNVLLNTYS